MNSGDTGKFCEGNTRKNEYDSCVCVHTVHPPEQIQNIATEMATQCIHNNSAVALQFYFIKTVSLPHQTYLILC